MAFASHSKTLSCTALELYTSKQENKQTSKQANKQAKENQEQNQPSKQTSKQQTKQDTSNQKEKTREKAKPPKKHDKPSNENRNTMECGVGGQATRSQRSLRERGVTGLCATAWTSLQVHPHVPTAAARIGRNIHGDSSSSQAGRLRASNLFLN